MVASCAPLANLIWQTMQLWDDTGHVPSSLQHCKLVCIPNKDKRALKAYQFRPICVLSCWWRAWSATWLRSDINSAWIKTIFPNNVAGGLPGSSGPEELAWGVLSLHSSYSPKEEAIFRRLSRKASSWDKLAEKVRVGMRPCCFGSDSPCPVWRKLSCHDWCTNNFGCQTFPLAKLKLKKGKKSWVITSPWRARFPFLIN